MICRIPVSLSRRSVRNFRKDSKRSEFLKRTWICRPDCRTPADAADAGENPEKCIRLEMKKSKKQQKNFKNRKPDQKTLEAWERVQISEEMTARLQVTI